MERLVHGSVRQGGQCINQQEKNDESLAFFFCVVSDDDLVEDGSTKTSVHFFVPHRQLLVVESSP